MIDSYIFVFLICMSLSFFVSTAAIVVSRNDREKEQEKLYEENRNKERERLGFDPIGPYRSRR